MKRSQTSNDTQVKLARKKTRGQRAADTQPDAAPGEGGHSFSDTHLPLAPLSTIHAIIELSAKRRHMVKQMVRNGNACLAPLRRALGWKWDGDEGDREKFNKSAASIVKAVKTGDMSKLSPEHQAVAADFGVVIEAHLMAENHFAGIRTQYEKALGELAHTLPVWPWVEKTRGLGPLGLALIVGEAGDLSMYDNPAKLWKRMGLAVIGGERQRKHTDAEKAVEHGYNPNRRALMWTIGDAMIKVGTDYKAAYDARKKYELSKPYSVKGETKPMPPIVAHRRAKRWMEKLLLKHLWRAWRGSHQTRDTHTGGAPRPHPEDCL